MRVDIVIPFRDRGLDPLRLANLKKVLAWWAASPWAARVVTDGRSGDEQFNRSAAYNRAARVLAADVIVYTEADMLLPYEQIETAIKFAATQPGLVVPFTRYKYLSADNSGYVRAGVPPQDFDPEWQMSNGRSIGAVNVVSRATLEMVGGYTERTEGNSYDDNIMAYAFEKCVGQTRWVMGPAFHLYHLPGWKGDHLSDEDIAATERNKALWEQVQLLDNPVEIRGVLHG